MSGASIEQAAVSWFVRLRDEAVTEADKAAFEAWLAGDPAHLRAYREMERLWSGLDSIGQGAELRRQADPAPRPPMPRKAAQGPGKGGRRLGFRHMALAASLAAVVAFAAQNLIARGFFADHRTGAGEQTRLVLEDGSRVHLNTSSAVSASFEPNRRMISLQAGEAFFEVASDPQRPFTVETKLGRVEVLGTAFSIKQSDDSLEIVVSESEVKVSDLSGKSSLVVAGQGVQVSESGLGRVEPVNLETAFAWQRGRLVFNNRRLGEVLSEVERYRTGQIVIMDSALARLPVTGSFSIDDTDAILDTIGKTLPVRIYRATDYLVLVFAP